MIIELLYATLVYIPLVVGLGLTSVPLLVQFSNRLNAGVSALAMVIFNRYVSEQAQGIGQRKKLLRATRNSELYRVYASKTLLYATVVSFGATMLGPYLVGALIFILELPQEAVIASVPSQLAGIIKATFILEFSVLEIFVLTLLSAGTFGAGGGSVTYWYRWYLLKQQAGVREALIEESIPRTVGFLFALSRSGMAAEQVVEILVKNRRLFGEAAEEFVVAHREISLMNADFVTATQQLARVSPSNEFSNLAEDLTSVMKTGRSLPEFLQNKYKQYQEEKERRQDRILEQVSALAEAYVALLVAGPLFLITILIIIGLLIGGTLRLLQVFVYFLFPITSLGFLYYVGKLTSKLGVDITVDDFSAAIENNSDTDTAHPDMSFDIGEGNQQAVASTDGGAIMGSPDKLKQLEAYNSVSHIYQSLTNPVYTLTKNPAVVLYALLPVATVYVLAQVILATQAGVLTGRTVDDYIIQATILVLAGFSAAQYLHDKELDRIERALPDFVERLADMTGAGMTLAESIQELEAESVPGMNTQITRLSRDIEWGGSVADALRRMSRNTRSVLVSRAVVLIINAKNASNQVSPVLRIAGEEAQLDRSLDKRRREEMLIYRMIIYLSFFVFIGIVLALILLFIPAIPSEVSTTSAGGAAGVGGLGGINVGGGSSNIAAYELILYHSLVLQGFLAGLVAGKMSNGSIQSGTKYSVIMVSVAYLVMLSLGA